MNPRLSSSQKSTSFPAEYLEQIKAVFQQNFQEKTPQAEIIVEGRIYPEEVLFKVGLAYPKQLAQPSIEISMNSSPKDLDANERILNCIDAAASFLTEYIDKTNQDEDPEFPLYWTPFKFEKKEVFMQFSTGNTSLEAQADQILQAAAALNPSKSNKNSDSLSIESSDQASDMVDYGYESEDALDHLSDTFDSEDFLKQDPAMATKADSEIQFQGIMDDMGPNGGFKGSIH